MKKLSNTAKSLLAQIFEYFRISGELKQIEETKNLCLKLLITELTTEQSIEIFEKVKEEFEAKIIEIKKNAQKELTISSNFLNN